MSLNLAQFKSMDKIPCFSEKLGYKDICISTHLFSSRSAVRKYFWCQAPFLLPCFPFSHFYKEVEGLFFSLQDFTAGIKLSEGKFKLNTK